MKKLPSIDEVLAAQTPDKWVNAINAVKYGTLPPAQPVPAWHDTPTVPGLWLCTEDERDPRDWICWTIEYPEFCVGVEDFRWYGPIPKDTK